MMSQLRYERADLDGLKAVEPSEISQGLLSKAILEDGQTIIVRNALQAVGVFDVLLETSFQAVEEVLGPERTRAVRASGFAHLHEHVDAAELAGINDLLFKKIPPYAGAVLKRIGRDVLKIEGDFFIETLPNARIIVPLDKLYAERRFFKEFEDKRGPGKLTTHGPHHDSWYHHPLNCINFWAAIAPVHPGNGLSIWPEVWGKRLPYDKQGHVRKDQYYGPPINFELAPGDAVLFAAEHLHGSEINRLDVTRYVVSMRMTPEAPDYFGDAVYDYVHAEKIRDLLDPSYSAVLDKAQSQLKRIKKAVSTRLGGGSQPQAAGDDHSIRWHAKIPPLDDVSEGFPKTLPASVDEETGAFVFDASELEDGEIRPLTKRVAVARIGEGYYAFGRFCPHQYADLAGGYVRDGKIGCPWHNLMFDSKTGSCGCAAMKPIPLYPAELKDGRVHVQIERMEREAAA